MPSAEVLFAQYIEAQKIVFPFLKRYLPELPEHKMLLYADGQFRRSDIVVPPVGFSSADEVEQAINISVSALPPDVQPRKRTSLTTPRVITLGSYIASFRADIKDNEIRDFVESVSESEYMLHEVKGVADTGNFFSPNVGCIAMGSSAYGGPFCRQMWKKFGVHNASWIVGVEGVTPYYISKSRTPVLRFFVKDGEVFYARTGNPTAKGEYAALIKDKLGKVIPSESYVNSWTKAYAHPQECIIARPPSFLFQDKTIICTGTMDGATYTKPFLDENTGDVLIYSSGMSQFATKHLKHHKPMKAKAISSTKENMLYGYYDRFSVVDLQNNRVYGIDESNLLKDK